MSDEPNYKTPEDITQVTDREIEQVGENVKQAAIKARKTEIRFYYDRLIDKEKGTGLMPDDTRAIMKLKDERDQALEKADTEFDHVPDLFTVFNTPSPIFCQAIRTHLSDAHYSLSGDETGKATLVGTHIAGWTGDAAGQFHEAFLTPFPVAVSNQIAVIDEMIAGVSGFEMILRQSRVDIKEIGEKSVEVLDSLFAWKSKDLVPLLNIITVLAGPIAAPPSGLASVALTLLSGGLAIDSAAEAMAIRGGTVDDILQRMQDNLDQVRTGMVDNENGLAEAFDASFGEVANIVLAPNPEDQRRLVPNRPIIANGPPPRRDFDIPTALK